MQESRRAPKGSEVELRIRAVGLNFRDVLNVMGSLTSSTVLGPAKLLKRSPRACSLTLLGSWKVSTQEILGRREQTAQDRPRTFVSSRP